MSITYDILRTDKIVVYDSAVPVVSTLPDASLVNRKSFVLKNINSGAVTVNTTSSQTIDGKLSQSIGSFDSITVQSIGTSWIII
jgi:hypothetical protein